ncbi:MAG: hypothetical protein ACREQL_04335 [Candidatus Binatia bacterium]
MIYLLGQVGLPQAAFVLTILLVLAKRTTLLGGGSEAKDACVAMAAEVARLATAQTEMSHTQTDLLVHVGKLETRVEDMDERLKILVARQ